MIRVSVENQQKRLRLNLPKIKAITKKLLRRKKVKDAEISLVFVNAHKIRGLNQKFLKRNYATDVLAFDLSDGEGKLIGDIVISSDAASKNAKAYNQPLARELTLYIIHGILHLLGYDDHGKFDARKMRSQEEKLLEGLGRQALSVIK